MKIIKSLLVILVIISILLCIFTYEQLLKYDIDDYTTIYFQEFDINANITAPHLSDEPVTVPSTIITIADIDYIVWYHNTHGDYIELDFSDYPETIPTFRMNAYAHVSAEHEYDEYTIYNIDRLYIQYDMATMFKLINSEFVRFDATRVPFGDVLNDEAGFFTWAVSNIKATFQLLNNIFSLLGGLLIL